MRNVKISYNPYTFETKIKIDNKAPSDDSPLSQFLGQHFQLWVDQLPGKLIEETNDDIKLDFHGTELDFQDLQVSVENYEKSDTQGFKFTLKNEPAKPFGEKEKALRELFNRIRELPFKEFQDPVLARKIEKTFDSILEVNVVATMSAGKSTLINALLGTELMPSKQGACTATITRIQDNDEPVFKATTYDKDQKVLKKDFVIDLPTMVKLNDDPKVSEIDVYGEIPFVEADSISLVLIDTPGPDNARDQQHGEITRRALDESSKMLVLFIMNGGSLHNDAQDAFLERIAESMKVGGKQSRDRFLFVINKMDEYDEEHDDIEGDTLPKTIEYLEEKGIKNPNIFPTAARPALLIRRYHNSNAETEDERKKLIRRTKREIGNLIDEEQLHLEKYPHLEPGCKKKIALELQRAIHEDDELAQGLIHSGIRGLEETIRLYVTKYSRPLKIKTVYYTLVSYLEQVKAFEKVKERIASNTREAAILRDQINGLNKKLNSRTLNDSFKKKVEELEIRTELDQNIRKKISVLEGQMTAFLKNSPEEMSESDAERKLRQFKTIALNLQNEFYVSVRGMLINDIEAQGKILVEEYKKKLMEFTDEVATEGLEIDLSSFVEGKLSTFDVESVLNDSEDSREEEKEEEYLDEVHKRYSGLDRWLHISRWFNPEYVEMEYKTRIVSNTVSYINTITMIDIVTSPIRKNLYAEAERIVKFAGDKTKELKLSFNHQFDEVDKYLEQKMAELKGATASEKEAKKSLAEAQTQLRILENLRKDLDSILEI